MADVVVEDDKTVEIEDKHEGVAFEPADASMSDDPLHRLAPTPDEIKRMHENVLDRTNAVLGDLSYINWHGYLTSEINCDFLANMTLLMMQLNEYLMYYTNIDPIAAGMVNARRVRDQARKDDTEFIRFLDRVLRGMRYTDPKGKMQTASGLKSTISTIHTSIHALRMQVALKPPADATQLVGFNMMDKERRRLLLLYYEVCLNMFKVTQKQGEPDDVQVLSMSTYAFVPPDRAYYYTRPFWQILQSYHHATVLACVGMKIQDIFNAMTDSRIEVLKRSMAAASSSSGSKTIKQIAAEERMLRSKAMTDDQRTAWTHFASFFSPFIKEGSIGINIHVLSMKYLLYSCTLGLIFMIMHDPSLRKDTDQMTAIATRMAKVSLRRIKLKYDLDKHFVARNRATMAKVRETMQAANAEDGTDNE